MRRGKAILDSLAVLNAMVGPRGVRLVELSSWSEQFQKHFASGLLPFLLERDPRVAAQVSMWLGESKAQLAQDLMVLGISGLKKSGYFVEFGATDGKQLSNTFLLESSFNWSGLLAEPARVWHKSLLRNRACSADFRLVSNVTGSEVEFLEAEQPELSTRVDYTHTDHLHRTGNSYRVETVTLDDLLSHHGAPAEFDYLSIDTEGSELDVLSGFDVGYWRPRIITIEHNFTSVHDEILKKLLPVGYKQLPPALSKWDSWFVLE